MRKPLNVLLTILLIAGVGFAAYRSVRGQLDARSVVTVRGMIGSEKDAFFRDPEVIRALAAHRLRVDLLKAGSRELMTRDLGGLDFAFPAGVPAANALRARVNARTTYDVFYTPIVVASWVPIVNILEANGVARRTGDTTTLNLRALLPLMERGTRWTDLKGSGAYPASRSVLITTTDVRTSNSAAMYLALISHLLNGEQVAQPTDITRLMPRVAPLFLRQGYQESSSAGPFEDYLALGAGKTPLVNVYESQYLEAARAGHLPRGAALLYPTPTVFTKHVLVPITPAGAQLGEVLSTDPALQGLAARYGFRTRDTALFQQAVKGAGVHVPDTLVDVVDLPTQDVMERMIAAIERQTP
ncbi:hypothetical protein [Deinococcus maricopensis]|uniref:Extracellular solute-binding protein n=1 Tax=Deinococcus maricopensis (strain DSM 21211 / LMG 22137 / NRRL B-23946 / LB-34) TaxID=709986 RepID=E8U692_DEIML|nr:hypothetical protein [Deinococcus maricopensis]ADV66581.1 hypothetical protein Deima_0927 [Deinococcus maricopensis DSM 21211]